MLSSRVQRDKDIVKIPLELIQPAYYSDTGYRFTSKISAFYISIDYTKAQKLNDENQMAERDFNSLKKDGYIGFAHFYLKTLDSEACRKKSNAIVNIDKYREHIQADSILGTTDTEQLFTSLVYFIRLDLIKVNELI